MPKPTKRRARTWVRYGFGEPVFLDGQPHHVILAGRAMHRRDARFCQRDNETLYRVTVVEVLPRTGRKK